MQIFICDDDILIIEQLEKYIRSYFRHTTAKCPAIVTFKDGESLLAYEGSKDIVFLDIEMPGMNGICVGRELQKQNNHSLIFVVTSHPQYLDEAMRFHVFRYLSKPIDKKRLFRNLKDALVAYHEFSAKIPLETKEGVYTLSPSEIIYIEAKERKVTVYTTRGVFLSVHTMEYWTEQLPPNRFFQSHRSFIVNFEYVSDFNHEKISLAGNRYSAYLTRRKYTQFKNAYLLYIETIK